MIKYLVAACGFLAFTVILSACQVTVPPASLSPLPSASATPVRSTVLGQVYYVSPEGNDASPGSRAEPWATIQRAADQVMPGDNVIILAGTFNERIQITRSGGFGSPITFQAEGAVVLRGFSIHANYITISGFEITNTPDDPVDGVGVFVHGTNCVIEGNYIHDTTRDGIDLEAVSGHYAETRNCIIRNNRLYRNTLTGIAVTGQDHFVEGNEIWGTIQYNPNWINPPDWVDADGIHFHGSGHIFRKNYIHDIKYGIPENRNPHIDCFQTWGDDGYHEASTNVLFEQNLCDNAQVQALPEAGQGFMLGDAHNLTIRNNIIKAYKSVNIVGGGKLTIVNNTFVSDLNLPAIYDPVGVTLSACPNVAIKNNIFYNLLGHNIWVGDDVSRQGLDVGYNSLYRSDGKPLWDSPFPHDLWGIDPMLVNPVLGDFHLRSSSPLIGAGVTRSDVPNDFDGAARPQTKRFDIGALQYRQP